MLDTYLKWFESHERILIVALVLAVGAFGINKWLDKSAMDANAKAAVTQQIADVQHDADLKIAAAVEQQTTQFNQETVQREATLASLVRQIAARDTDSNQRVLTVTQPRTNAQAIDDLNIAYRLPIPLTTTEAGSIPIVDLQAFTVAKIQGDTAQADLVDTRKELVTTTTSLASATSLVAALQNQVTGLNTEIKDVSTAKDAEIASVKAKARKSKVGFFKFGFVVGYVAGVITGHYIP